MDGGSAPSEGWHRLDVTYEDRGRDTIVRCSGSRGGDDRSQHRATTHPPRRRRACPATCCRLRGRCFFVVTGRRRGTSSCSAGEESRPRDRSACGGRVPVATRPWFPVLDGATSASSIRGAPAALRDRSSPLRAWRVLCRAGSPLQWRWWRWQRSAATRRARPARLRWCRGRGCAARCVSQARGMRSPPRRAHAFPHRRVDRRCGCRPAAAAGWGTRPRGGTRRRCEELSSVPVTDATALTDSTFLVLTSTRSRATCRTRTCPFGRA